MTEDTRLIEKIKNGDKNAFNELVKNNLYLAESYLNKFNYSKENKEDILQDGYLFIIDSINEYLSKDRNESLNNYLHKKMKYKMKKIIQSYNTNHEVSETVLKSDWFDFVLALENKELVNQIKKFIIGTDYFTFMQKNVLMAKLGLINNRILSDVELGRAFGCSPNNFYIKFIESKGKLRGAISSKKIEDDKPYHFDLFSYLGVSEEIGRNVIKKHLSKDEINLLKKVWSNDFSLMSNFEDIYLSEEEILSYYKVIGKLYNIIVNMDVKKETVDAGANYGYAPRR